MLNTINSIFRVPELRKKILITVGLLFIYRIGSHVPLPGVNIDVIKTLQAEMFGALGSLVGIFNAISAGGLDQCTLFSLGIMPYISSSIIFSLLVKVVPALEKLSKEGASGQKKINQYTRLLTVPICIVQSLMVVVGVMGTRATGNVFIVEPELYASFAYKLMCITGITAGTIFLMWLGEQITEYGVGNGISLLIMAGIVADLPSIFMNQLDQISGGFAEPQALVVISFLFIGVVISVVFITKGQRRIPIQQAKLTRGRKMYGGQRHYLPFKVNQAGVMPVIFASALLTIPSLLFRGLRLDVLDYYFDYGGFWYVTVYIVLVFFFAYFWNSLMFQPTEMANNLKEHGSFIPGIRPGKRTAEFLENVMVRITLVGASFLAFIAVFPMFVTRSLDAPGLLSRFLGGTTILIVVGVALDLVDKINSYLRMRDYEGFMKKGRGRAR
ncbi:MAG: preprotein translocase subunit SecY [Planctomycetes bacterium]|nr:preprotein translocase subunit SecY [Planctomycetota bacterium]